jgi:malate dehydrogenase (oxaloacetate-decarboxylating)(NADP+)
MPKAKITREDALHFHLTPSPGKWEVQATVPMNTQRDLSLAYSPGVAVPCEEIAANPETAYDYTNKGNLVAVISNGTAVLGLGNLGALGSKPVMEGKSVLFKRFADVNSIDLEFDTEDADEFITGVRLLAKTFGGINLEDIKAPECFIIEQQLKEELDIPVFHDDQHGTAVICAAGLINALHLSEKKIEDVRIVVNGAGAAGIACIELLKRMGARHDNCIICDTKGVVYQGRDSGMNQWKSAHAITTELRTLEEAMEGADVFLGVSAKGAVTQEMVANMAPNPVIFAMANPDPEITPEEAHEVREDAIIATGRSDYPNQVNNVLGFPYLFRGALDIHARAINDEMKIACAEALALLARQDVPDEVGMAYGKKTLLRARLHHPHPVRPSADLYGAARRCPGRHGNRRRAPPDHRHGCLRGHAEGTDGPDRFDPAQPQRACACRTGDDDLRRRGRSARAARGGAIPTRRNGQGHRRRARGRRAPETHRRRARRCGGRTRSGQRRQHRPSRRLQGVSL